MSQKKAALDVLKKRLKKIAPFILFILNDNKMDKEEFYKPLRQFVDAIEYSTNIEMISKPKIISQEEINAINFISEIKKTEMYNPSLELLEIFQADEGYLIQAFKLNSKYRYPNHIANLSKYKNYKKNFAEINKIKRK